VDWQEGSEEAAEVYERKVVAEIRTRSERQEAFPQLDRIDASESARQGSAAMPRGDIFLVRHLNARWRSRSKSASASAVVARIPRPS